jgi:hypothetical protein
MNTHTSLKGFYGKWNAAEALVPEIGSDSTDAFKSTPTDLLELTNATEVLSVDYFDGNERQAVCLVTKTDGEVYSHTKSICDRVEVQNYLVQIHGRYLPRDLDFHDEPTVELNMRPLSLRENGNWIWI